jgi:shikimate kinase
MNLKVKKLKEKKPEFIMVLFYGPFAVGKHTVAKEFQKQTGYKFFHNHHTFDLAREFFDYGTLAIDRLVERLRLDIFEEIALANMNTVATHAYSADYVSKTGLSDPAFMRKVESFVEKAGGKLYSVHLQAEPNALLKRVMGESRKKFKKLRDLEEMKRVLKKNKDWVTPAPVKNNIEINNTNLSPKQVVKKVRDTIGI